MYFPWSKVKVKVAQSCPTLCNPLDYTVHGILQARILEWGLSLPNPGIEPGSPPLQADSLPAKPQGNPMDCSLPEFSIHGIFQARVLEWVAISFSRGSSQPRDRTQVSCIIGIWATRKNLGVKMHHKITWKARQYWYPDMCRYTHSKCQTTNIKLHSMNEDFQKLVIFYTLHLYLNSIQKNM